MVHDHRAKAISRPHTFAQSLQSFRDFKTVKTLDPACALTQEALLELLLATEARFGRVELPHPRLHERRGKLSPCPDPSLSPCAATVAATCAPTTPARTCSSAAGSTGGVTTAA